LNVAAGIYSKANEEADAALTITQSDVTIQGAPGATSIIDGTDASGSNWNPGIEITGSNVTIRGLAVRNVNDGGTGDGIKISSGTGSIIEGCKVYDNDNGIAVEECSPEIRKNKIYDNEKGIYITVSDGSEYSPVIVNNLIYDSTSSPSMEYGIYAYAVSTGSKASPAIYHNTIDNGTMDGIYINEDVSSSAAPDIK